VTCGLTRQSAPVATLVPFHRFNTWHARDTAVIRWPRCTRPNNVARSRHDKFVQSGPSQFVIEHGPDRFGTFHSHGTVEDVFGVLAREAPDHTTPSLLRGGQFDPRYKDSARRSQGAGIPLLLEMLVGLDQMPNRIFSDGPEYGI
jgi:hypothetical protein